METIATLTAYPFDSLETVDEEGNISYDREIDSETYANFMSVLFSNGVMLDNAHQNALKVEKIDEDTYMLHAGNCIIQGRVGILKENVQFTIPEGVAISYVTSVALKMSDDVNDRNITVKVGIFDNSLGVIGEDILIVAEVVTQGNSDERELRDLRFDSGICGIAHANPYNLDEYENLLNSAINDTLAGQFNTEIKALKKDVESLDVKLADTKKITDQLDFKFIISEYEHKIISVGTCAANTVTKKTYNFEQEFSVIPDIQLTFYSNSESATVGSMTLGLAGVTKTGFSVHIFNNTSSARTPGIRYTAQVVERVSTLETGTDKPIIKG